MDLFPFFKTIIFLIFISEVQNLPPWFNVFYSNHGVPQYSNYFCKDNKDLAVTFSPHSHIRYGVWIKDVLEDGTEITVKFDSVATVFLYREYENITNLKLKHEPDSINNIYKLEFTNKTKDLRELFSVRGEREPHHPPYITSFKINGIEKCLQPILGFFEDHDYTLNLKYFSEAPNKFCGRRKVSTQSIQTPLIVGGSATTAGWWPWHAALYTLRKGSLTYTCGGTLISKYLVLTAAHCVTLNSAIINPEILGVQLGKYSLFGQEATSQSIGVFEVIVHDDFEHRSLNNDIALLKLLAAAQYNNYVQPACLWFDGVYDQLGTFELTGTVPGWGFDATDTLTKTLLTATMTIVPDVTCILFEPVFYQKVLNGKKFCAGYQNGEAKCKVRYGSRPQGCCSVCASDPTTPHCTAATGSAVGFSTSPCNGDSGGGYVIFVYDKKSSPTPKQNAGAWYVKGIVSMTLSRSDASVCNPEGYTVFTDVAQYRDWILNYLNRET